MDFAGQLSSLDDPSFSFLFESNCAPSFDCNSSTSSNNLVFDENFLSSSFTFEEEEDACFSSSLEKKTESTIVPTSSSSQQHTKEHTDFTTVFLNEAVEANDPDDKGIGKSITALHLEEEMPSSFQASSNQEAPVGTSNLEKLTTETQNLHCDQNESEWSSEEQHCFFSFMKMKNFVVCEEFATISKKITTKSEIQVEMYYNRLLSRVRGLLESQNVDTKFSQPNQIRLVLWCWYRVMMEYMEKGHHTVRLDDEKERDNIAKRLQKTYQSCHQQIVAANESRGKSTPTSQIRASHNKVLQFDTPKSDSTTFSISADSKLNPAEDLNIKDLSQITEPNKATDVKIHEPMVRRKSKRKRKSGFSQDTPGIVSTDQRDQFSPMPLLATPKRSAKNLISDPGMLSNPLSPDVISYWLSPNSGTKPFYSQSKSSSSKRYFKVRLIPVDPFTKRIVTSTGAMSKIELKTSELKKISDICKHMNKKWVKILEAGKKQILLLPPGISNHPGWTSLDSHVTCSSIWKELKVNSNDTSQCPPDNDVISLEYKFVESHEVNGNALGLPNRSSDKENDISIRTNERKVDGVCDNFLEMPHGLDSPNKELEKKANISDFFSGSNPNCTSPTTEVKNSVFNEEGEGVHEAQRKKKLRRIKPTLLSN